MTSVTAQTTTEDTPETVSFRAYYVEITMTPNESGWNDAELMNCEGQGIVITAYNETSTVMITNKYQDEFTYFNEIITEEVDETGHNRLSYMYNATDKDGTSCMLVVQYYEDGHLFGEQCMFRFRIAYDNVWYGYYANPILEPGTKAPLEEDKPLPPGSKRL
jgi:hypothetical protein